MPEEDRKRRIKTSNPINSIAEANSELAEMTTLIASLDVQLAAARRDKDKRADCEKRADWEGRTKCLRALAEERRIVLKRWIKKRVAQEIARRRQVMAQMFATELDMDNDLDLHKACLRLLHELKKTLFETMTDEQRDMLIFVLSKLHAKIPT